MGSELLGVYLVILEAEWMVGNGKKRVGITWRCSRHRHNKVHNEMASKIDKNEVFISHDEVLIYHG